MAHRMLPKDDIGLQTVARLQRELISLAGSLPKEKKLKEHTRTSKSYNVRKGSSVYHALNS